MKKIIVADIFGKTPALITLANSIQAETIVDPYDGEMHSFEHEAQAYHYFSEHVGLDNYVNKLSTQITPCDEDIVLIGFSVGAAAIWQLSASISANNAINISRATCFYGAQIRHLTQLTPKFEVSLIFPRSEPHFEVTELIKCLANKQRLSIRQVDYLHGFMNELSTNYNPLGYAEHVALLQQSEFKPLTKNIKP